jgi:hypothetical protein
MQKCGTEASCYGCPLAPDDTDKYYDDNTLELMGQIAERYSRNPGGPVRESVEASLMVAGISASEARISRIQEAAKRVGTLSCVTK